MPPKCPYGIPRIGISVKPLGYGLVHESSHLSDQIGILIKSGLWPFVRSAIGGRSWRGVVSDEASFEAG